MRREEDNSFPAGGPRPRPGFAIFRAITNAVRKPKEPWWSNKTDVIEKNLLLSLVTIDTLGITLGPECSGHHRRFVSALTLLTWQYLLPTHKSELCKSLRFSIRIDAVLGQYLQYLQHMSGAENDIMMFEPKPNDKIPQINDIPSFTDRCMACQPYSVKSENRVLFASRGQTNTGMTIYYATCMLKYQT